MAPDELRVTLQWWAETAVASPVTAFVHLVEPSGLVAQSDQPPGAGLWPHSWWQPGLVIQDVHVVALTQPFDPARQQLQVGLYETATLARLPVWTATGDLIGDSWSVPPAQDE